MLICIFLLLNYIFIFLFFVWKNKLYLQKVLPCGLATAPEVFIFLTKYIIFLCHCKRFSVIIYLHDFLVLIHSKHVAQRARYFLCSLFVCVGICMDFSKFKLHFTQNFCFLGLCWNKVDRDTALGSLHVADTAHYIPSDQVFLSKANFCANRHAQIHELSCNSH